MERIEPTMAGTATAHPEQHAGANVPTTSFRVRFSIRPAPGQRGTVLRTLQRKGALHITDDEITLIKFSGFFFQRLTEKTRAIPRQQIFNVRTLRKFVYFDIHSSAGIQRAVLVTSNSAEARHILECLPAQATDAHVAERQALASYSERILQLAPVTWVTYGLIAINVLVYLAMCAGGVGVMAQNVALTVKWGTNFGPQTLNGGEWRLLTSVFVHFGLIHLLLNMVALYQIGQLAERLYGSGRFLTLYLFAGVIGSLVSVLWHPLLNSAGASGAIFGVFGALLVFVLRYRNELPKSIALQQRISIPVLIAYNLFYGFTHHGIDNGAHLGGLLGGLLLGFTLARPLSEPARSAVSRKSTLLSCGLACVVLAVPTVLLMRASVAFKQELGFVSFQRTLGPGVIKATNDGLALLKVPVHTPEERAAIGSRVLQEVVPQWEMLYAGLERASLPDASPRTAVRAAMLHYVDDNRKLYRLAAEMALQSPTTDDATQARFKALERDSMVQVAEIKRLAASGGGGSR